METHLDKNFYVPSIEEFYIGFEFEHKDSCYDGREEFQKAVVESDNLVRYPDEDGIFNYWEAEHLLSNILYDVKENNIRVKYLDASDIEEFLNIKPKLEESYIFLKDVNFRPNWLIGVYAHKIRIFFNPLTKWLKVEYLLTGNEEFEKFFEGSVKNKSEFIKLLRFLGYE